MSGKGPGGGGPPTCADVRERLLEAAPADLAGAAETPVAEHLRACPACRAAADRVLEANAFLDASLAAVPKRPADEVVARLRRAEAPARRPSSTPLAAGASRISRPWRLSVGAGLAAAAVLAALLVRSERPTLPGGALPGGGTAEAVGPEPGAGPIPAGAPGGAFPDRVEGPAPLVEEAGGDAFAVFATSDPDVTVVWIYEEGT